MDPRYFTHTLTLYEAELFIRGMQRRYRAPWAQARYIAYHTLMPHCKPSFTFDDMGKFGWELDEEDAPMSWEEQEKALDALRQDVLERDAEWLKKQELNDNGRTRRDGNETSSEHEGV